jgi:hypothetical protein
MAKKDLDRYYRQEEKKAVEEAKAGKPYTGRTWHGLYAYWKAREDFEERDVELN